MIKIVVVGLGYVGTSNAVLLAQHNHVIGVDLDHQKVNLLNSRRAPILDIELSTFLHENELHLSATTNLDQAIDGARFVIVSTPTDFDHKANFFDTSSVEKVIEEVLSLSPTSTIIIKSTIPIGFVDRMRSKYNKQSIIFSPEFLREGNALYDNLYPSRIVIGDKSEAAQEFVSLLKQGAKKKDVEVNMIGSREAEAVKLFSNSFLALRVAFFNELDTFAMAKNMSSTEIISAVCADPRIGMHYNNPSFGYGGYCLPKDTKQLLANFGNIPQNLISAIIESNSTRINFIADEIKAKNPETVGAYRLLMKQGSDNFRQAAVYGVLSILKQSGINIVVYEPELPLNGSHEYTNIENFDQFCKMSDVIVANRNNSELINVKQKLVTRDIFERD